MPAVDEDKKNDDYEILGILKYILLLCEIG
jgi:hypothetical protein